jgi:tRNA(Ile)-lysidine synthase
MSGASSQQYFSRDLSGRVHLAARQSGKFHSGTCTVDLDHKTGEAEFEGLKVFWRTESRRGDQRSRPVMNCEYFDAGKINRQVVLRYWRPGDRFQPIGMKGTLKLQDFFTNEKVPQFQRFKRVVATAMNGEIFWIEGLRISDRFKLSCKTKSRLQWRWCRT